MKVPVLLLGAGVTALGVQRSLARRGVPYFTLDHEDRFLRHSRWTRPLPAEWGRPEERSLGEWLTGLDLPSAVLFPCSDSWCMAVAELPVELTRRFSASVGPPAEMECLVDKAAFLEKLDEFEVAHPMTVPGEEMERLKCISEDRLRGFFLKPTDSQRFMARHRVKGVRVASLEEAETTMHRLGVRPDEMVMQEYIPGPPRNHYFIDGFVDAGGTVRSKFARQRLRMSPPDFGNSTLMQTVPVSEVHEAAVALERLLAGIGHRGIFSAEFKKDARDDRFRLLEVNARAWWFVEFATTLGVDVCYQYYLDALGRDVPDMNEYPAGRRCVYPYHDYQALVSLGGGRPGRLARWVRSIAGASQPVFSWSDPGPAAAVTAWMLKRKFAQTGRSSGASAKSA